VIRQICDRIAIMYLGRIVEIGDADAIFDHRAPYTALCFRPCAMTRTAAATAGTGSSSAATFPRRWHRRPRASSIPLPAHAAGHCDVEAPQLRPFDGGSHQAACHYPLERWPMTDAEIREVVLDASA